MAPQTVSGGLHVRAQFSLLGAAHRTEMELQLKYLSFSASSSHSTLLFYPSQA